MNVRGSKVAGTVFSATKFHDLLCAHYNATPPPTFVATTMAVTNTLVYAMHIVDSKDFWPLHAKMKCVINSYTSLDETSPQ